MLITSAVRVAIAQPSSTASIHASSVQTPPGRGHLFTEVAQPILQPSRPIATVSDGLTLPIAITTLLLLTGGVLRLLVKTAKPTAIRPTPRAQL